MNGHSEKSGGQYIQTVLFWAALAARVSDQKLHPGEGDVYGFQFITASDSGGENLICAAGRVIQCTGCGTIVTGRHRFRL